MENAVTVREEITESKVIEYMDSAGITDKLMPSEKKMFFNIAREFGLNPFKRELHITAYGQGDNRKCSIVTGYEVYIKRAERTGKLNGWKVWVEGNPPNATAKIQIYRKDWDKPFEHEVYYSECVQYNREGKPNAIWAKMGRFMLKKVCIGQAFRLCFADEMGGMPYEEAEMPQYDMKNVTEKNGFYPTGDVNPNTGEAMEDNEPLDYTDSGVPTGALPTPKLNDNGQQTKPPVNQNAPGNGQIKPLDNNDPQKQAVGQAIAKIFETKNTSGLSYFDKGKRNAERVIYDNAPTLNVVKMQFERLQKELADLQAKDMKSIPFGDDHPNFKDDIPYNLPLNNPVKQEEIF